MQNEKKFYSIDLANKSYRNSTNKIKKKCANNNLENTSSNNFEDTMINSIANIELALITLLKK